MVRKQQVIEFGQNLCNANIDDNSVLFVRVGGVVTDKNAMVVVPLTHTAIVIKGGGDYRYYKSGSYPIFENKEEIKNWKKGLSVEVVYIPKETRTQIRWGTPNRLKYRDEASNKVISVGARGEFDVSVSNPEQFFRKVVGVKKEFNALEFTKRFGETVATEFADIFLKTISERHLTYDQFMANKKEIGDVMEKILNPKFEEKWGLSVLNFLIADFDLNEDDLDSVEDAAAEKKRQEKLKEYLAEVERLDDKQWERDKFLRQLELQDKAAYYEVLKVVGKVGTGDVHEELKCPVCGAIYQSTDKFCPNCGKRVSKDPIICPDCGRSNSYNAKFCANCGKLLIKGEDK